MPKTKRPRNREERLERCLRDVQTQLGDHAEYQERFVGADPKENETLQLLNRLCTRIARSLTPQKGKVLSPQCSVLSKPLTT